MKSKSSIPTRTRRITTANAASIYKQRPPLVNACRKPGEWQTYDIIFEAPRFDATAAHSARLRHGAAKRRAGAESFSDPRHDGLRRGGKVQCPCRQLPLWLQYHGNPVRFRNIWIREVPPSDAPSPKAK